MSSEGGLWRWLLAGAAIAGVVGAAAFALTSSPTKKRKNKPRRRTSFVRQEEQQRGSSVPTTLSPESATIPPIRVTGLAGVKPRNSENSLELPSYVEIYRQADKSDVKWHQDFLNALRAWHDPPPNLAAPPIAVAVRLLQRSIANASTTESEDLVGEVQRNKRLAASYSALGSLLLETGEFDSAVSNLELAMEHWRPNTAPSPLPLDFATIQLQFEIARAIHASALFQASDPTAAALHKHSHQLMRDVLAAACKLYGPDSNEAFFLMSTLSTMLRAAAARFRRCDGAAEAFTEAERLLRAVVDKRRAAISPKDIRGIPRLAESMLALASARAAIGGESAAAEANAIVDDVCRLVREAIADPSEQVHCFSALAAALRLVSIAAAGGDGDDTTREISPTDGALLYRLERAQIDTVERNVANFTAEEIATLYVALAESATAIGRLDEALAAIGSAKDATRRAATDGAEVPLARLMVTEAQLRQRLAMPAKETAGLLQSALEIYKRGLNESGESAEGEQSEAEMKRGIARCYKLLTQVWVAAGEAEKVIAELPNMPPGVREEAAKAVGVETTSTMPAGGRVQNRGEAEEGPVQEQPE